MVGEGRRVCRVGAASVAELKVSGKEARTEDKHTKSNSFFFILSHTRGKKRREKKEAANVEKKILA